MKILLFATLALPGCEQNSTKTVQQPTTEDLRSEFDWQGQQWSDSELQILALGKQVYESNCAVCHLATGEGQAMMGAPALKGGVIVKGDVNTHVQLVLNGSGDMPGFGESLNHEEIAAVVSYERNAWGNQEGKILTYGIGRRSRY